MVLGRRSAELKFTRRLQGCRHCNPLELSAALACSQPAGYVVAIRLGLAQSQLGAVFSDNNYSRVTVASQPSYSIFPNHRFHLQKLTKPDILFL